MAPAAQALVCLLALCASVQGGLLSRAAKPEVRWKSAGGNLMLNGLPFNLKGANWFGFETEINVPHGLWGGATTMDRVLKFCRENKINALRIPVSLSLALDPDTKVQAGSCDECSTGRSWDVLDALFGKAAAKGVLILLDMHRLNNQQQGELWWDNTHSEADLVKGWVNLLKRFGQTPNLLGIDLKNEPHGQATWGMGKSTDWDAAAVRIVTAIKSAYPAFNRLIFVEGVGTEGTYHMFNTQHPSYYKNWGGNLDGVSYKPIDFGSKDLNDLLVYSPHVYGPSVADQPYFNTATFPDNMPGIWDEQFGWIEGSSGKAVVTGEWGGWYTGQDKLWQEAWVKYLRSRCLGDNFVWCINPDSSDTGGLLLNDWTTPDAAKMALLSKLQPTPSVFTSPILDGALCVDHGAAAAEQCRPGGTTSPSSP
ncbi:glycoside hydrolase superfamily [Tribonema minus]|uniref:Glycoside hydrolase superfamily n=1 Tax=Tribonema minus TaxID=303371 RepID=A0A835ZC46_9STRA|nr:glycoside hydrolase superfamily [Tribonema minus]